jgi:diguanylate cyclase (GGDEF)-like protein/PAS domain S-box-containing protein
VTQLGAFAADICGTATQVLGDTCHHGNVEELAVPEPRDLTTAVAPSHATGGSGVADVLAPMDFLDGLLDHAGDPMYACAPDGRILLANATFARVVGRTVADVVGCSLPELLSRREGALSLMANRSVLATGAAQSSREPIGHADGSVHEYAIRRFPLYDAQRVPYAVGVVASDVTEFATAHREIRAAHNEAETLFRGVFDYAPIGQIFSGMDGQVTAVNGPMAAMLGYTPDEMIGRPTQDFADPDEFRRIRDDASTLMDRTNLSVSAIRHFRHRDGYTVPVRATSALLRTEDDRPRWWVSIVADITAEERNRGELDRAHHETLMAGQRLRLLNSIAAVANESADIESIAPQALREVCEHFGWPAGALVRWPDVEATDHPTAVARWTNGDGPTDTDVDAWLCELWGNVAAQPIGDRPVTVVALPNLRSAGIASIIAVPLAGSQPRYVWVFFAGKPAVPAEERELLSLIGIETARVVERQSAYQQVRNSDQRFRSMFAGSPLPMALSVGETGTFAAVNDALCQLLGRPAEELIGHPASAFMHPEDVALADPAGAAAARSPEGSYSHELRFVHASGAVLTTAVTLTWMASSDGSRNLLAQVEDVTGRRRAEDALRRQSEQDGLTGLANRAHLTALLRQSAGTSRPGGVVFVDLDGFKLINDTLGHEVGDQVLVEVADRIRSCVRPTDSIARFAGDEFVVLCTTDIGMRTAGRIATRIERALAGPILTQAGPVDVTASVGVACGPITKENPSALLQRADVAMYQAKRRGKDRVEIYDARLHQDAIERQRTESALRNALAENRFVVFYQPIVQLAENRIVGFEALVRLEDEHGQLIAPDRFIGVAEKTGLIVPLGGWVLREACLTIAKLRSQTKRKLTIAVNVAARQASRPDLVDTVSYALRESGLSEDALALELTESALLEVDASTLGQLNELRSRGVRISLDDFGTGYSSLSYLRTFPVTSLKVDRSFVSGITEDSDDVAIVRSIIQLARDMDLGCVAEGIETEDQRALLAGLGVELGQGYLFSRPIPADRLCELFD